ncbi:major facilitator superfamily domain-containing protein, partial [Crucibulum laeve]
MHASQNTSLSMNTDHTISITPAPSISHLPLPGPLPSASSTSEAFDIEHVPVKNDPREWSRTRKNISLVLISSAAMVAGLAANIQNPAVEEMQRELPATSGQFSLSISMFILLQGLMPLFWSAVSEVKGRKIVYLTSLALFTVASIVVALSRNIGLVIGFRSLQAAGSSAVLALGAATLADIFDPSERGAKMGVYYMAPLLGPATGPIFGGVLTTGLNWRAIFWFLTIVSGTIFIAFVLFFKDTFRRERSLTYQTVLKERLRAKSRTPSIDPIPVKSVGAGVDIEKQEKVTSTMPTSNVESVLPVLKLSLKDVNPFKPIGLVLRRMNNLVVLFASGKSIACLLFAFNFLIVYTSSRTLSSKYHYNPLKIGLVTLAYGLGCVAGSLLGGRWSDRELARLKTANGRKSYPEMRLKSTILGVCFLPPFVLAFGWVCDKQVHVSAICVMLFGCGFFSIWTYTSTLAYIVDANNGRSSTAVATNSAFRGLSAFVATEIAVPLQDGLGDGAYIYT